MISNLRLTKAGVALSAAERLISGPIPLVTLAFLLVMGRFWLVAVQLTQSVPAAFIFDEDAYYVFAVARNLAHGRGITADGTQWTNGFQPLWAFIVAVPYLVWADDSVVLASVAVLSAAIWLASALLFVRLVRRLSDRIAMPDWLKWAVAVLFLADLQLQSMFFNGLETGLYVMCILAILVLVDATTSARAGWRSVALGLGLGVLILARNDGVFLAAAVLIGLLMAKRTVATLRAVICSGAAMSMVVLPWLVFNLWLTGSLVPQSGSATNTGPYASTVSLSKLGAMAGRLAQLTFTPFPMNYSRLGEGFSPMANLLAVAAIGISLLLIARRASLRPALRVLGPLVTAVVCLTAYYLVGSGAVWMYDRYLIPFKVLSLSIWAVFLVVFIARVSRRVAIVTVTGVVALSAYYQLLAPTFGSNMTADLLWLESSPLAQSSERIGMFESGRSGYAFPGRVENLDGKVNLEGLRAIQHGEFLTYLERTDLDVLVLRDYYLPWLDASYPEWRSSFVPNSAGLAGLLVACRPTRSCASSISQVAR